MRTAGRGGWRAAVACAAGIALAGCGGSPATDVADGGDGAEAGDGPEAGDEFDGGADDADAWADLPEGYADPWTVMPAAEIPPVRGWTTVRGIIHAHSVYSHDACDDEPFVDGVRNEQCFQDLRAAVCATAQDFLFLTDHDDLFADHEFPDVLLWAAGDRLIERGGIPVANRIACPDGREVIVAAGTESGTMPIGLERHVGDTPEERRAAYNDVTPAGLEAFREAGALDFVMHTEEWEIDALRGLPLDGIEIYNLHANLMDNLGVVLNLIVDMGRRPERVPVMELGLVPIFVESEADLTRWATLVQERPTVGIVATDVHRNTFSGTAPDGDRIDSYRRLMHWFSNYVLVSPGGIDDAALKEAILAGRLYGAFDDLGYAVGFDFRAERAGDVFEMGSRIPAGDPVDLHLVLPHVYDLNPGVPPPAIRGRILKAEGDGWTEVAAGDEDLTYSAGAGVYRGEVRIDPQHLRPWMGSRADTYLGERPWVYANPVYVGTGP
jgi:hypothetical protein